MFEVSKSVPPPKGASRGGRKRYPFDTMQPGQSFFVSELEAFRARTAAAAWKRRHPGWEYQTKAEEGGLRIWRL